MESVAREPDAPTTAMGRRVLFAASFGTYVEYYDFVVYGYMAATLAVLFFPTGNPTVGLLLTFGAFAASYLFRPLGAVIFAPLGDRYGRRAVLAAVILLMTVATAGIGVLPTYAQVGVLAPLLLTFCRLLQGISAGGEFGGASAMIAEFAPPRRRGYYLGFIVLTNGLALLTGSVLATVLSRTLSEDALLSWGWRLPFLLSLPLGVIGLFIRFKLEESPHFERLAEQGEVKKAPLRTTLRRDWRQVLLGMALTAGPASILAVYFIYMPAHLVKVIGFEAGQAQLVIAVGLTVYCASVMPLARLTDRIGRKRQALASSVLLVLTFYPAFALIAQDQLALAILAVVVVAPVMAANFTAITPMLTELFATDTRYTGLSLGFQTGTSVFAGPTPAVLTALAAVSIVLLPALYAMALVTFTIVASILVRETVNTPLRVTATTTPETEPAASGSGDEYMIGGTR